MNLRDTELVTALSTKPTGVADRGDHLRARMPTSQPAEYDRMFDP